MSKVSVIKTSDYSSDTLKKAVENHFELLGLDKFMVPGAKIVIKPNLLLKSNPEDAVITRAELVREVILKLKSLGAGEIVIAESPGGLYNKTRLSSVYSASGYDSLTDIEGVSLNFDISSAVKAVPDGKLMHEFEILSPIASADLVINICKLKTHSLTGLSGSVKNLFGTIPGLAKPEFHFRFQNQDDFCNMLVDLARCVKPAFTFVDAVYSMEGEGPSGGTPIYTGLTLASADIYALDRTLVDLAGFTVEETPIVKCEIERGLAPQALSDVELVGDGSEMIGKYSFKKPETCDIGFDSKAPKIFRKPWRYLKTKLFTPKPAVERKICIGCGRCAETCPAKTIKIVDKQANISYDSCIKCFCCQEMCPVRAIYVKRFLIFKL